MSTYASTNDTQDPIGSGLAGAVILHVVIVAILIATAIVKNLHHDKWGEATASTGSIEASMVSAIPLPNRAVPVDKSVLTPEVISKAAETPPKEATQPPPKPTDIEIKAKAQPTKVAPTTAPAPPKHPQPTPPTPKAAAGEQATQLPQSISQATNGSAALTVADRAFGARYAYYLQIVSKVIAQNWLTAEPASSQGKSVKLTFDIQQDGTPINVRIETPSGSKTLDVSAIRAIQRVDKFAPLPSGNQLTVEDTFNYHAP